MPLAFDLTSTFVIGSILPVATTLFARSPFSTFASFEGSIFVPPLDAITTPVTIRSSRTTPIELQMITRLRFFFLLLPLPSTTASCEKLNLRTFMQLLLRKKPENSSCKNGRKQKAEKFRITKPVVFHLVRPRGHEKESDWCGISLVISIPIVRRECSAPDGTTAAVFTPVFAPPILSHHRRYPFGMLELGFHDCIRAAAGVRHPAPGSRQCLLRRCRVRAGQRPRNSHPATDRSAARRRPHCPQTPPATQPGRKRRAAWHRRYQSDPRLAGRTRPGAAVRVLDWKHPPRRHLRSRHRRRRSLCDDHQPARHPRRTRSKVSGLATRRTSRARRSRSHGRFPDRHPAVNDWHAPRCRLCPACLWCARNQARLRPLTRRTQAHHHRRPPFGAALARTRRDAPERPRTG